MIDPTDTFAAWFAEAEAAELNDPNAMTLATIDENGQPSARIVLLKDWDATGFVFYTNTLSRKGLALAAYPACALLFHWKTLRRQVRIEGVAAPVSSEEADDYFASRPRLSRLGAWASAQSTELDSRATLQAKVAEMEQRFAGTNIPRPPYWSGYRVRPDAIEYWQDMPFRLHDRIRWTRHDESWQASLLYP